MSEPLPGTSGFEAWKGGRLGAFEEVLEDLRAVADRRGSLAAVVDAINGRILWTETDGKEGSIPHYETQPNALARQLAKMGRKPESCPHTNATADVLEGDGRGHQVLWCRDCGAYARKFEKGGTQDPGWTAEWRLPCYTPAPVAVQPAPFCLVCHTRAGEPEGHAEWCPRGLAELEDRLEAHGGRGVDLAEAIDARRGPVAAYQHALQGKPEEVSDNVSLPGAEGEAPGEGEAGLPGGEDPGLVIRPLCPECRSTEVVLAHVHSAQADAPAIVVLCDACRLASIGQVPREQLDAVIRRVRATRNGDWRYRVNPS